MNQPLRILGLLILLGVSACGRAPSKTSTDANPVPRATPQIIAGLAALPQEATTTILPTATSASVVVNVPYTVTVMVQSTSVVATRIVTATPPPTPTLLPTWTATPSDPTFLFTPTLVPQALGENCDNPGSQITFPRQGQVFRYGVTIPVTGTANIDHLLYWKVQYEPEATYNDLTQRDQGWGELYASEKNPRKPVNPPRVVVNGLLMEWQTRTITRGTYYLRLMTMRFDGSYIDPPCTVKISVQ